VDLTADAVRTRVPEGRTHSEFLLRQVYGNLNAGRTDVAMTNMCQAIRVALAAGVLSDSENVLLRLICRDHGGFL
jgi:hypothetical protein